MLEEGVGDVLVVMQYWSNEQSKIRLLYFEHPVRILQDVF
jgi:hypothetical protein